MENHKQLQKLSNTIFQHFDSQPIGLTTVVDDKLIYPKGEELNIRL